ncbi:replication factor-a protein [Coprinellus micaceus]|uniref:Replication protein A subunit n=1 Tax=Coprinellus micaceus TaxID=71717 RepID=A0A4Y7TR52_COPMI|nr:replication factor-a protein [Coprinellus micaceus]
MSTTDFQLSAGSCKRLQTAPQADDAVYDAPHTIQFLSIKKVNSTGANGGPLERYRIIVSDGIHFIQAMLATQLNPLVNDQTIARNTVAVIEKSTCNTVQGKKLIIVLSLRVVGLAPDKIGQPVQLDSHSVASETPAPAVAASRPTPAAVGPSSAAPAQAVPAPSRPPAPTQRGRTSVYPIEGLSPYQNNWTIKARVTQKSDMKTWSNQRGEGKLFNVTFMDETGEIRATAFNMIADELYPQLQEGKVYYVSKARVNLAKKKFSNLSNDYELGLEKGTEIEECHDTAGLPVMKYNFVPLAGLLEVQKDSTCDVIGVVKDASPLSHITSKATQREIPKRELTLVDKSSFSVRLTLWGKQAEQYNAEENVVTAFKGVRVGDFGGRSLSMVSTSTMQVNPDIPECFDLRGWYDSQGAQTNFHAHSNLNPTTSMGFRHDELKSLDDVKQAGFGMPDRPEYFSTRATIMHIKADNLSYPACPTAQCNKKVTEIGGVWRCEKCDKSFEGPEHRYIMSMSVADYSGQAWLQGFNEVGTTVFGMTANELLEIKDRDEEQFNLVIHKAMCSTYNFSCRAKQDTFNEQTRIRYGISRIYPLNYREEANRLKDLLYSSWAR